MIAAREKIVIIGANDFQNQLILKARQLGYETHVFAWQTGDVGEKTADVFYPISIVEKEHILKICRQIRPVGICSIASDLAAITVNYIANELGLIGNSIHSSEILTNKHQMRAVFSRMNDPSPVSKLLCSLDELSDEGMKYPLIVKPTDRSGSRGISKVENRAQLVAAAKLALEQSFEKKAILEEFVMGKEYSVEGISQNGKHYILGITEKFTTGTPHFIETGHMEPSGLSPILYDRVCQVVLHALDSLEVQNSASHAEVMLTNNGDIKIIEIGGRMGGDCIGSDLVSISTGFDYLKMVLDVATGKTIKMVQEKPEECGYIHFIFNEKDIATYQRVLKEFPQNMYRSSKIGQISSQLVKDSSMRYGYFILKAKNRAAMKMLLRALEQEPGEDRNESAQ